MGTDMSGRKQQGVPRWARICAILGAVLMVTSGGLLVSSELLVARYAGSVRTQNLFKDAQAANKKVSDIKGPLNILLVGVDPRKSADPPKADAIIVVHVSADLQEAYLFSIPRDLYVNIPPLPRTGYQGGRGKINSAMAEGSRTGDGKFDPAQGFELLSKAVSKLTGIQEFDAGAIINFGGFKKIVDAMGGVTMTIDQRTRSEHLQPDGTPRPRRNCGECEHPYYGPQKVYEKGKQHLQGWEALDFVRQRYGLPKGDYDRQRHQQQFIKAMAEQALSKDVATNPLKLDKVLRAAGQSLVFDGKGHTVVDWGLALKGIRPDNMTTVKLPGGGLNASNGAYLGETFGPEAKEFFAAVRDDAVGLFILDHPEFINRV